MGYREEREKRHNQKDEHLFALLVKNGFEVEKTKSTWRNQRTIKIGGAVVALIRRNKDYYDHNGWRVSTPDREPRGHYEVRRNAQEPQNPEYWGAANYKCPVSVLKKIQAASKCIPGEEEIAAGKALESWRDQYRRIERLKSNLKIRDPEFVQWLLTVLPDLDDLPVGRNRNEVAELLETADRLQDAQAKLDLLGSKLREANEAVEAKQEREL